MHAFSGAILRRDHDVALPTVDRIDGESLILFSSKGTVGEWPLDRVKIIVVGNGYFEVVAEDRRLSLVVDEPEAFEEALVNGRAPGAVASRRRPVSAESLNETPRQEPSRLSRFLFKRPRHGRANVRAFPMAIGAVVVLTFGYLLGAAMGDLVQLATTEGAVPTDTPRAEIVVRTFQGSGDQTSAPFTVVAPWQVEWSVEGTDDARLELTLLDSDGEGDDLRTQEGPGQGAATLREGGVFVLEMRSSAGAVWSVRVVEVANPNSR